MLKKYLSFLILTALIGFLAACGSSGSDGDSSASGSVTLNIQYYTEAISDGSIEAAKEEFSDYTLKFTEVPADDTYDVKLRTSLNSDSAPDIVTINSNIEDFLPYADKFVNLLDYEADSLEENYVEWKWQSAKTADESAMIAMPIDIGPTALYYRIDLFEEAGLPTDPEEVSNTLVTSEDYMEAAAQLLEEIDTPMFRSGVELLGEEYRKLDKGMYNEEGELVLADGELKEIWDYTVKAIDEGYTLGTRANSIDMIIAQNEGMFGSYISASWGVLDVKDADQTKGKWRITRTPGGYANQGGSYLAVLGNSNHPDEAVEVVKFLTDFDSQMAHLTENSLFPSHQDVYDTEAMVNEEEWFGGQDINEYFIDAAENIEYVYRDPRDSSALSIFTDEIHLVESQGKDPEKAWEDAVKKAEQL